jgi:hypothetical protein
MTQGIPDLSEGKHLEGFILTVVGTVLVRQANRRRTSALFINDSAQPMYLAKALTAAVNRGIRLNPNGGSYEINSTNPYYGPVSVACGVINQNLLWEEDEA